MKLATRWLCARMPIGARSVLSRIAVAARGSESAKRFVVDECGLSRMLAADRAFRILFDFEDPYVVAARERIEINHPADQRLARAEQKLDRLERFYRSDKAWQRAEHSRLRARRRHVGWCGLGIEASIAGDAFIGLGKCGVAREGEDGAIDQRLLREHARIVDQIASRKIVAAIDDDVVILDYVHHVFRREPDLVTIHLDRGIERVDRFLRRLGLHHADPIGGVNDLALEIRKIDGIEIHQPDGSHSGRRKIERRGRAERSRAEQQDLGIEEFGLTLLADFGNYEMTRVARDLILSELAIRDPRQSAILP